MRFHRVALVVSAALGLAAGGLAQPSGASAEAYADLPLARVLPVVRGLVDVGGARR